MVRKTMLKSSLREIRQSLGRYLAILAIVGLGVGFFAGLRMSQPSMMATGIDYIRQYRLYDFRLLSTLGFTEEDVDYFSRLDGVGNAQGAVFTDFLTLTEDGDEAVMKAHSLTDGVNLPELVAGRMPQAPDECLGDSRYFTEADLGRVLPVIDTTTRTPGISWPTTAIPSWGWPFPPTISTMSGAPPPSAPAVSPLSSTYLWQASIMRPTMRFF